MLIVAVLFGTVGYTLMYAAIRVPIGSNGQPDYTFVYQPWQLWVYAARQINEQFAPQQIASQGPMLSAGQYTQPAVTETLQVD
jgi:hypothetical protein